MSFLKTKKGKVILFSSIGVFCALVIAVGLFLFINMDINPAKVIEKSGYKNILISENNAKQLAYSAQNDVNDKLKTLVWNKTEDPVPEDQKEKFSIEFFKNGKSDMKIDFYKTKLATYASVLRNDKTTNFVIDLDVFLQLDSLHIKAQNFSEKLIDRFANFFTANYLYNQDKSVTYNDFKTIDFYTIGILSTADTIDGFYTEQEIDGKKYFKFDLKAVNIRMKNIFPEKIVEKDFNEDGIIISPSKNECLIIADELSKYTTKWNELSRNNNMQKDSITITFDEKDNYKINCNMDMIFQKSEQTLITTIKDVKGNITDPANYVAFDFSVANGLVENNIIKSDIIPNAKIEYTFAFERNELAKEFNIPKNNLGIYHTDDKYAYCIEFENAELPEYKYKRALIIDFKEKKITKEVDFSDDLANLLKNNRPVFTLANGKFSTFVFKDGKTIQFDDDFKEVATFDGIDLKLEENYYMGNTYADMKNMKIYSTVYERADNSQAQVQYKALKTYLLVVDLKNKKVTKINDCIDMTYDTETNSYTAIVEKQDKSSVIIKKFTNDKEVLSKEIKANRDYYSLVSNQIVGYFTPGSVNFIIDYGTPNEKEVSVSTKNNTIVRWAEVKDNVLYFSSINYDNNFKTQYSAYSKMDLNVSDNQYKIEEIIKKENQSNDVYSLFLNARVGIDSNAMKLNKDKENTLTRGVWVDKNKILYYKIETKLG